MGKSAFDVAALLDVLAPRPISYLQGLSFDTPAIAIGVADDINFEDDEDGKRLFREASDLLGELVKCTDVYVEGHLEMKKSKYTSDTYELTQEADWKEYLGGCEGDLHSLGNIVAWHEAHPVSSPVGHCHWHYH